MSNVWKDIVVTDCFNLMSLGHSLKQVAGIQEFILA